MLIFFCFLLVLMILFLLNFTRQISKRFEKQFELLDEQDEYLEQPTRVIKRDPLTGMIILSPSEEKWLAEKIIHDSQEWDKFLKRKETETPLIFEKVYNEGVGGRRVLEVGDLCWENNTSITSILLAIRYEDDRGIGIISYDGIEFRPVVDGKFIEIIQNLAELPCLELDEDHIDIHIEPEHHLIAQRQPPDFKNWSIDGEGWSGSWATKKFGEHGITFDASEG